MRTNSLQAGDARCDSGATASTTAALVTSVVVEAAEAMEGVIHIIDDEDGAAAAAAQTGLQAGGDAGSHTNRESQGDNAIALKS